MNNKKKWDIFDHWFDKHGHWMFGINGKDKAIKAWSTHGIDGIPKYEGERPN